MKTVKSFTTNNLVEGHDIYVKFMNARFENLKKEGRETDILFYKRGKAGSTLDSMSLTRTQRWDIFKWHCMTLTYNIWCDLVKDYIVPDKSSILYKKHVDVPEDILKKFKYRVEQSIKNARCDYNSKNQKSLFDACRYLAMYWTYLDIVNDCKTQRYFPNAETVVRAQKIFDYARYTNPFYMNGKFSKSAIRDTKETKEMADTTNCFELENLDFSVRTYNILKRAHVNTLDDILKKTYNDLIKISNIGKHSLNEIVEKLKEQGYEYANADELPQLIKNPNNTDSFDKNKLLTDLIEDKKLTNPLYRANIHTVGDYLAKSDKELLKIRTFGVTKLRKVREIVNNYAKQTTNEVEEEKENKIFIPVERVSVEEIVANYEEKIREYEARLQFQLTNLSNTQKRNKCLEGDLEKARNDINLLNCEIERLKELAAKESDDILLTINKAIKLMKAAGIRSLKTGINGYAVDIEQRYSCQ